MEKCDDSVNKIHQKSWWEIVGFQAQGDLKVTAAAKVRAGFVKVYGWKYGHTMKIPVLSLRAEITKQSPSPVVYLHWRPLSIRKSEEIQFHTRTKV